MGLLDGFRRLTLDPSAGLRELRQQQMREVREQIQRTRQSAPPLWSCSTLPAADTERLARYNAERARGIVHTPEWDAAMAQLQRRFDGSSQ